MSLPLPEDLPGGSWQVQLGLVEARLVLKNERGQLVATDKAGIAVEIESGEAGPIVNRLAILAGRIHARRAMARELAAALGEHTEVVLLEEDWRLL